MLYVSDPRVLHHVLLRDKHYFEESEAFLVLSDYLLKVSQNLMSSQIY